MKKSDETPTTIVPEQTECSENIDVHSQGNIYIYNKIYIMYNDNIFFHKTK